MAIGFVLYLLVSVYVRGFVYMLLYRLSPDAWWLNFATWIWPLSLVFVLLFVMLRLLLRFLRATLRFLFSRNDPGGRAIGVAGSRVGQAIKRL
ncbi:hypothetical protein A3K01_00335 [candidate division WWE3 bacterium RIFOXYD1_FULL_43_17]|nr:MAG: hypothetical protein A3K01_00335 [candidate division WWE3 bacterium RIFOXYD1_FULL_43_17]